MMARLKQSLGLAELAQVPVPGTLHRSFFVCTSLLTKPTTESITPALTLNAALGLPPNASCAAFCPVSRLMAVGTQLGLVKLFGTASGTPVEVSISAGGPITHLAFVSGKHRLLCVSGAVLSIINLVTATLMAQCEFPERITALCAPYNRIYAYVGTEKARMLVLNDHALSRYAVAPEQVGLGAGSRHVACLVSIHQHPSDEFVLLLGYSSGLLVEWNLANAAVERRYEGGPPRGLMSAAWKRDGKMVIAGYETGAVVLWDRKAASKPSRVFFEGGDHRPVKQVLWSEKGGASLIVCVGGTPKTGADGFCVLSGSPLSSGKMIVAQAPVAAFFVDQAPFGDAVDPLAFVVASSDAKLFAYDARLPLSERPLLGPGFLQATEDPLWHASCLQMLSEEQCRRWRAVRSEQSKVGGWERLGGGLASGASAASGILDTEVSSKAL
jgi:hypothetical protein